MDESYSKRTGDAQEEPHSIVEPEADAAAPPGGRTIFSGGVLSALGHRDYRLLWTGAFVSNIGTWIHTAALLWFVKLRYSNTWVGTVNMATYLPVIFFVLFAGSLADRFNRKRLIFITQMVMMLGALALAVYTGFGLSSLYVIVIITIVMGTAFAFNFPAWQAILPDLVPGEDLLNGIALNAAQFNLARFVGPAICGLILKFSGVSTAFYVNAASFLAVMLAIYMMRTSTPGYPAFPGGTTRHIWEGVELLKQNRWAVNILAVLGITSFFGLPYIVLMPSVARDVLGRNAGAYGWLLGLSGLGAVIGAPLVTYLSRHIKENQIIKLAVLGLGVFLAAFSLAKVYWVSLVLAVGLGTTYIMIGSSVSTLLQSRVERSIRGRVMSFYVLMLLGAFPLGGQLLGYISDVRSTPFALFLGGAVCLFLAFILIIMPGLTEDAVSRPPEEALG